MADNSTPLHQLAHANYNSTHQPPSPSAPPDPTTSSAHAPSEFSTGSRTTTGRETASLLSSSNPVRYVLSEIHPSLAYLQTVGVILVIWLSALLSDPMIGCYRSSHENNVLVITLAIVATTLFSFLVLAMLAELHHYYPECGGTLAVAASLNCWIIPPFMVAAVIASVVTYLAYAAGNEADLVGRLTDFYLADLTKSFNGDGRFLTTVIVILVVYGAAILGVRALGWISALIGPLCLLSCFAASVYGIRHKHKDVKEYQEKILAIRDSTDNEDNEVIDRTVITFVDFVGFISTKIVYVILFLSLTEDNKLKKPVINIVGGVVFGVVVFTVFLMTLSFTHITSFQNIYIDEITMATDMPYSISLAISIVSIIATVLKCSILLLASARLLLYLAIKKEEAGYVGILCSILKMPAFVNVVQISCAVGLTLFLNKSTTFLLFYSFVFLVIMFSGCCHLLHRYTTTTTHHTTPLLGNFGSFEPIKAIRILIVVLVIASLLLPTTQLISDHIDIGHGLTKQIYTVVKIVIALIAVGAISVIASFPQQPVHKYYTWLVWTPVIPACLVVAVLSVTVLHWIWGGVAMVTVLLLGIVIAIYNTCFRHCCCVAEIADASSVS